MKPLLVGLNIKHAPVEMLESLSIHHSQINSRLHELTSKLDLSGALILSTCNRLEFYAVAENSEECIAGLQHFIWSHRKPVGGSEEAEWGQLHSSLYSYTGEQAVRHLYQVVSGLDSLVLGETEILGQVSRAYEQARKAGTTDKILNVLFQKALSVGKLVRSRFGMDQYHTSIGRIAVDLAEQELQDLSSKQILILGAGEMSELTMKHLIAKTSSLAMIANRSLTQAERLADEYGFAACPLDELESCLIQADLVFSATSSKNALVSYELAHSIMQKRAERPLVFIDMAVPRDIDPRVDELSLVRRFDIKQLRDVRSKNHSQRVQTAQQVEALIEQKIEEFADWHNASSRRLAQEVLPYSLPQANTKLPAQVLVSAGALSGEGAL